MNRIKDPGQFWGPGLIIIALLMVLVGYLGAPRIENKRRNEQDKIFRQDRSELNRIWKIHHQRMIGDLNSIGPQDFRLNSESDATFDLMISPEFDELLGSYVRRLTIDVTERFPDRSYIVCAKILFFGSAMHFNVERPSWHTLSSDLPAEAYAAPESYQLRYEYGAGVPIIVPFLLSVDLEGDERRKAYSTLNTIFRDSPLTAQDVAGNSYPIGVRGETRLVVYLGESEMPLRGYSIATGILNRMGFLGLFMLLVTPPVWVFLDARRKRLPAVLWGLFTLPTSFVGALIYTLSTRESGPTCPECGERVTTRFVVCPYCQTELKGTCSTCGQTVGLNWHYCPSCATEL